MTRLGSQALQQKRKILEITLQNRCKNDARLITLRVLGRTHLTLEELNTAVEANTPYSIGRCLTHIAHQGGWSCHFRRAPKTVS